MKAWKVKLLNNYPQHNIKDYGIANIGKHFLRVRSQLITDVFLANKESAKKLAKHLNRYYKDFHGSYNEITLPYSLTKSIINRRQGNVHS